MSELFFSIKTVSDTIAQRYDLDLTVFFVVYFLSFLPFYFGYLLIFYGTTRKLKVRDIFSSQFKKNIQWNKQVKMGLLIHLIGRVMPYGYILLFGENLPIWVYILLLLLFTISLAVFLKRIFLSKISNPEGIEIMKKLIISDPLETGRLWEIYNQTFEPINKISPCKQSLDHEHFLQVMEDGTVGKYILRDKILGPIGIALVTNNFKNTTWISEEYFKKNYINSYEQQKVYYFMGLAIDNNFRGKRYSIPLMEYIFEDVPNNAILGFDHSRNVNPMLHHFTKVVKQAHRIERYHIDRQHYHVIKIKR